MMRKLTLEVAVPDALAVAFEAGEVAMMVVPLNLGEVAGVQYTLMHLGNYHDAAQAGLAALVEMIDEPEAKAKAASLASSARVAEQWHSEVVAVLRRAQFVGRTQKGPLQ